MKTLTPFKIGPLQQKVLAALKSGRYQHIARYLARKVDGSWRYDVFGVFCETLNVAYPKGIEDCLQWCPDRAVEMLRLFSPAGEIQNGRRVASLAKVNDESTDYAGVIEVIENTPHLIFEGPA